MGTTSADKSRSEKVAEASGAFVRRTWRDPKQDMARERNAASIDVERLAVVLAGGEEKARRKKELCAMVQRETWASKDDRYFMSREKLYRRGLEVAMGIRKLASRERLSYEDAMEVRKMVDLPGGFELHFGMFIPTLLGQGTEEQLARWLEPAWACKIIGAYAQTELGHGTFLRGLEITASFDEERDVFVVHSPTPTAVKWWPGGLGKTATHSVVMCRLFLKGRDHGPHPFMIQVRDLETHLPLEGITVGDIGPKMGYNGVDNGFLRFDHVVIPRFNLLARYAKVTREGAYVPPPKKNTKSSYATMVGVRADIVKGASEVLSKAATIAVRYNAVRRQTSHAPGQPEETILNYQQSARNLIPVVSQAYALHFMGRSMWEMYLGFEKQREETENFDLLPELHATSSCLKSVCTWMTVAGLEMCRQSCGGQGYSDLSGLPGLYTSYVQNLTWEGDNTILCLQTARFIAKHWLMLSKALREGEAPPPLPKTIAYLEDAEGAYEPSSFLFSKGLGGGEDLACEDLWQRTVLDHLMSRRCLFMARAAMAALEASARRLKVQIKLGEGPAWSASHVTLVRLAKCHGQLLLHNTFFDAIETPSGAVDPQTRSVLRDLARLFTLTIIEDHLGDFLEAGLLAPSQAGVVHEAVHLLLARLRTEAVGLVDAFAHDDYVLHSAIGSRDGDYVTRLVRMAEGSPFNETQEGPAWRDLLGPFLNKRAGGSSAPRPKL